MYLQSSADPDCDYMLHWFGIEWAATISSPFKGKYCAWWGPSIRKIIRFWPDCYLEIFHHKCMEDDQLVKYGEPMISSTYQLFQFVNHLWIHNFIAIIILILIQVYFLKNFFYYSFLNISLWPTRCMIQCPSNLLELFQLSIIYP